MDTLDRLIKKVYGYLVEANKHCEEAESCGDALTHQFWLNQMAAYARVLHDMLDEVGVE